MSLRHCQAVRVLEKRLDYDARVQDWHRHAHAKRQQQLMAHGVTREHVELLPEDVADPLPTPIIADLTAFRRESSREELIAKQTKARQAFQGPWLQSTDKELHDTSTNLLSEGLDEKTRKSLEAYQVVLQDKLKQHHSNLGFTLDCTIALEERKRASVALGLLSKEHRHLVTTLFQTLPTIGESSPKTQRNNQQSPAMPLQLRMNRIVTPKW